MYFCVVLFLAYLAWYINSLKLNTRENLGNTYRLSFVNCHYVVGTMGCCLAMAISITMIVLTCLVNCCPLRNTNNIVWSDTILFGMFKTLKIHYSNTSEIVISLKFQPAINTWFTVIQLNCFSEEGDDPYLEIGSSKFGASQSTLPPPGKHDLDNTGFISPHDKSGADSRHSSQWLKSVHD